MSNPRENADDAYQMMMGMSDDEWSGLVVSLLKGGVLTPAEQEGFDRACADKEAAAAERDKPWYKALPTLGQP